MKHFIVPFALLALTGLASLGVTAIKAEETRQLPTLESAYRLRTLTNPAAYIPPQCYTKTQDDSMAAHNPCYVCHTASKRPNFINDASFQLIYSFSEYPRTNHWSNLFIDRSERVAAIKDEEIDQYIQANNYIDADGAPILKRRLAELPPLWDYDGNGRWDGYIPDAGFRFDDEGFDHDRQGGYTGWRAFGYSPFPGTFWPTNGNTGDVMIRLPEAFRSDKRGRFDLSIYKTNLAIVEAMIREHDIPIDPTSEKALGGIDVDKDGKIGIAEKVAYDWAPAEGRLMWYVGAAYPLQKEGRLQASAGLYPQGTEFLHSVRYVDIDQQGAVHLAPRMKELRYARKGGWLNYPALRAVTDAEFKERRDFPDRLRTILGDHEHGVSNGKGWSYTAFIEDAEGALRPQTYEELTFCVGCHGGIGATEDGIFSFGRKRGFDAPQHGWSHWTQQGLKGMPDPLREDGHNDYGYYLEQNGAGDEFRANTEVRARFFDSEGKIDPAMAEKLKSDIALLLAPSAERAHLLNKAYKAIVEEQSFIFGRDATIVPPANVHRQLDPDIPTGITAPINADKLKYQ